MATYYVSSSYTGSVSNGSQSTPWKTLSQVQNAMSSFLPGDLILFKCGDTFNGTLAINKSGLSGNPIKFGSYGSGSKPKFSGTGSKIAKLFDLYNRSYIIFENLWIIDEGISATDRTIESRIQRGWVLNNSNNIIIRSCNLDRVGVGIYMTGSNGGFNTIEYCDIGNMRMVVNTNNGGVDDYGANPIVISSSNNIVRNNYFHGCWAQSWDFTLDGGSVELYEEGVPVSNNQILYNTFYDCNGVAEFGGNGGILDNNLFAYNKCIWNGSGFYINNSGAFAVTVTNLKIFNNVFIEHDTWRLPEDNGSAAYIAFKATPTNQNTLIFRNNVVQLYGYLDVFRAQWGTAGVLIEGNNVYKRNTKTSGSLLNIPLGAGSVDNPTTSYFTNTTDTNPLNWDYTPLINSILINKGINVGFTKDFLGNNITGNPDIGIIELSNASPLSIMVSNTPITIYGGISTITVTASGGVAPYTGVGTFTRQAGIHEFTIIDANGTNATKIVTITQPAQLLVTSSYMPISTINGTTSVTLSGTGGVAPYTYSKDDVAYIQENIFTNLSAGIYTFYVKDANGTKSNTTVYLTQPTSSQFTIAGITIRTKNGVTPLSYSINGGQYTTNQTFNNLRPGMTYTIRAKDGQGVVRTMTVTIQE